MELCYHDGPMVYFAALSDDRYALVFNENCLGWSNNKGTPWTRAAVLWVQVSTQHMAVLRQRGNPTFREFVEASPCILVVRYRLDSYDAPKFSMCSGPYSPAELFTVHRGKLPKDDATFFNDALLGPGRSLFGEDGKIAWDEGDEGRNVWPV